VRPQSGLSLADHVWEYQMEGFQQTRYTAIYYSQSPEYVGSVRSARLIDTNQLIYMYDGLLAYSGCSTGVCWAIQSSPWVDRAFREDSVSLIRIQDIPRPGTNRYHLLFAVPEKVWEIASERGVNRRPAIQPMIFDPNPPSGGIGTANFIIDYPELGPLHRWEYDKTSGKWLSFTEDQRFRADEEPDVDFLTGEQLGFDNVVLIYAEHSLANFIEDEPNQLASVEAHLVGEGDAVLMRDGARYNCRWARPALSETIRLYDFKGNLLPLKPGTVWFNVASSNMFQPDVAFSAK